MNRDERRRLDYALDLATAKVEEVVRSEAWNLLRQTGVVSAPSRRHNPGRGNLQKTAIVRQQRDAIPRNSEYGHKIDLRVTLFPHRMPARERPLQLDA
jgi:hypothetical protein